MSYIPTCTLECLKTYFEHCGAPVVRFGSTEAASLLLALNASADAIREEIHGRSVVDR